jgi:hypothetical protein
MGFPQQKLGDVCRLINGRAYKKHEIFFSTKSSDLLVTKKSKGLEMDFPASMPR